MVIVPRAVQQKKTDLRGAVPEEGKIIAIANIVYTLIKKRAAGISRFIEAPNAYGNMRQRCGLIKQLQELYMGLDVGLLP
jgi:hypothetical protein